MNVVWPANLSARASVGAAAAAVVAALCMLAVGCRSAAQPKGGLEPFAKAGVTDQADPGRRLALVVGIDAFDDPKFSDLQFARADAEALADKLDGFDEVVALTGTDETGRAHILAALANLLSHVQSKRDVVVVYFSTHGTLARAPAGRLERYLVARDTQMSLVASTGLAVSAVVERLNDSPSERSAVILATCHSGAGKSRIPDKLAKVMSEQKSAHLPALSRVSEASIVLSAAGFREAAREVPKLGHDVYTYFLLQALDHGDRDGDGAVTVSEAHDWARRRTYAYTDGAQRPTAWSAVTGADPIVLAGRRSRRARPVIYSYQPSADGVQVAVDGTTKGTLPGGVAVAAGSHHVELRQQTTQQILWEGDVDLSADERIEASRLVPPSARWRMRVGAGGFGAVGPTTRRDFLPLSWAVSAQVSLAHLPWADVQWELRATYFGANASADAFATRLPYRLRGGHVQVGAAKMWAPWTRLQLLAGADLGMLWAARSFQTDAYRDRQSLYGPTATGFGEARWRPFGRVEASLRMGLGIAHVVLGNSRPVHPIAQGLINVGTTF